MLLRRLQLHGFLERLLCGFQQTRLGQLVLVRAEEGAHRRDDVVLRVVRGFERLPQVLEGPVRVRRGPAGIAARLGQLREWGGLRDFPALGGVGVLPPGVPHDARRVGRPLAQALVRRVGELVVRVERLERGFSVVDDARLERGDQRRDEIRRLLDGEDRRGRLGLGVLLGVVVHVGVLGAVVRLDGLLESGPVVALERGGGGG